MAILSAIAQRLRIIMHSDGALSSDNSDALWGRDPRRLTQKYLEWMITGLLMLAAGLSILTTVGIAAILLTESAIFFEDVGLREFLLGTRWTPLLEPRHFGVLPIVQGTLFVAFGASMISVPLGVGVAIYLSEYASRRFRRMAKPILELLAGIPSVVFGYFALTTISPILRELIPITEVFNAASAAIVVGFMTLPMVASLSDDAFQAVPGSMRDSGYAMGATKFEVIRAILLPAASSGIVASFILAFSRAIGETMAVTLAAGATPKLTLNPFESIQTMTAYVVQVSLGDAPHGTVEYYSIFAVGALLFLITLILNLFSSHILKRLKSRYA